MPLLGDSTLSSGPTLLPARQPTAAMTAPPGALPCPPGDWTTTSVTTLARKQPPPKVLPVQSGLSGAPERTPPSRPVGRSTLTNVRPASVDRYRPTPVAA